MPDIFVVSVACLKDNREPSRLLGRQKLSSHVKTKDLVQFRQHGRRKYSHMMSPGFCFDQCFLLATLLSVGSDEELMCQNRAKSERANMTKVKGGPSRGDLPLWDECRVS